MATQMGKGWTKSMAAYVGRLVAMVVVLTVATVFSVAASARTLHVVAMGDSLTAGYNLPAGQDFATRLEAALRNRGHDVRLSNAGVSGDTTTGGLARLDWAVPTETDVVILELGANDALRGISPDITRRNLDAIIAKLKARKITVLLAGMRAPANWGPEYVRAFDAIYPELAAKHGVALYPFFMAGVIERPELKLSDALHPNEKGVAEIVRRILPHVENVIRSVAPD